MSLRVKLALIFALVAIGTTTAVAILTPTIVRRGFERAELAGSGLHAGGQGLGPGPRAGQSAGRVQEETTLTVVAIATIAAVSASALGFVVAGRLVGPLRSLREAAAAVAAGDLARRSGLASRSDEIGELGRSFDRMAEALYRSDALRRRMFQDAAHELKTPLTVIDATTTAILDGVYEHDDGHLRTIRQQSQLLGRIVNDLRTASLAESGQLPLDLEPLDVDEVLGATLAGFGASAELAGIALVRGESAHGLRVRADRARLLQALGALVDNALHQVTTGGVITLRGVARGGVGYLSVEDDGPGIPPEDLPHVFERFYRSDMSRQRSSGGSGLGLAIVRSLALAQGGAAGAENLPAGGARLWISLPLVKVP
jgi:two-component system sensor histidine kinase BaeS